MRILAGIAKCSTNAIYFMTVIIAEMYLSVVLAMLINVIIEYLMDKKFRWTLSITRIQYTNIQFMHFTHRVVGYRIDRCQIIDDTNTIIKCSNLLNHRRNYKVRVMVRQMVYSNLSVSMQNTNMQTPNITQK